MRSRPKFWLAALLVIGSLLHMQCTYAYQICPGTGLFSRNSNLEIVVFEHTEMGTGGLVLNCPMPLSMGNLIIPRFHAFKELPLMLGCGMQADGDDDDDDDSSTVPLGEVSPWFWLHNLQDISGSFELQGACGPLYMGGNIEEATKRLQENNTNPLGRFKFFRRYKSWQPGELEEELANGKWEAIQQDPAKALEPIMPGIKL